MVEVAIEESVEDSAQLALFEHPAASLLLTIVASNRQHGNPLIPFLKEIRIEYANIVPDYLLSLTNAVLFISLKYHRLHPAYLKLRIAAIARHYRVRILLCLVDLPDYHVALEAVTLQAFQSSLSLFLAWSPAEAARLLQTFKSIEDKPPDSIQARRATDVKGIAIDILTSIPSINKVDCATLMREFTSMKMLLKEKLTNDSKTSTVESTNTSEPKITPELITTFEPNSATEPKTSSAPNGTIEQKSFSAPNGTIEPKDSSALNSGSNNFLLKATNRITCKKKILRKGLGVDLLVKKYNWNDSSDVCRTAFFTFLLLPQNRTKMNFDKIQNTDKMTSRALDIVREWQNYHIHPQEINGITTCNVDTINGRTIAMKLVELGLIKSINTQFSQQAFFTEQALNELDNKQNNILHIAAMSEDDNIVSIVFKLLYHRNNIREAQDLIKLLNAKNNDGLTPIQCTSQYSIQDEFKRYYGILSMFTTLQARGKNEFGKVVEHYRKNSL